MFETKSMQLKKELAEDIIDMCQIYGAAEVIRATDTNRILDMKPKIIAPVYPTDADQLEREIHEKIDEANTSLKEACEKIGRPSTFRRHDYSIKRIKADEVTLSIGSARTSGVQTGKDIIDWCDVRLEKEKARWEKELKKAARSDSKAAVKLAAVMAMDSGSHELWSHAGVSEIMTAIQRGKIRSDEQYLVATVSGNSYRATYFDVNQKRRVQISVGHILIVETDNPYDFRVTMAKQRRTRSDYRKNEIARTYAFTVSTYTPTENGNNTDKNNE